jgi:K+/H+ antiporter YhaU regulatory subunit KhtT
VHDYSANHIGRRTIKVILEAASEVAVPEPDFVNNKAIIARTMAMNLAYPQIQESVMELVSTQAGTPEVELFSPEVLGIPVNEEWAGGTRSMHFGVIQHILDSLYVGYAVAVGYILASNGELVLSPSPATKINWYRNDRIVTIIRHAKRTNTNTTMINSLSSSDGSHATYKADGKRVSMKEIEQQSANDAIASVVRMTMQPAASLDAVLEHQKRAAMVETHTRLSIKFSLSFVLCFSSFTFTTRIIARHTSHLFDSQHEK